MAKSPFHTPPRDLRDSLLLCYRHWQSYPYWRILHPPVPRPRKNTSKYKLLKPRIKIKPINLNGVNINYASGSNAKNIVENSIGKGSIVKITRSGDVIPFIFEVIKPAIEPDMPKIPYKWNENKVDIIVVDDEDNISEIKMISSFFSNMGIKNISDSTVEKIYNSGYKTLKSIFEAKKEDFEKIDGFQKTLAQKIYDNIHNGLKNTKKEILLGSASILGEGIGKRKIKRYRCYFIRLWKTGF